MILCNKRQIFDGHKLMFNCKNRMNQSQLLSGARGDVEQSTNPNMLSFANSFAHYPNPMMSQRGAPETNIYEVNAVDMSLDALYLHELNHMEVRRRAVSPSTSAVHHHHNNNQNYTLYQDQLLPEVHSNVVSSSTQQATSQARSSSSSEKTPLLLPNTYRS